LEDEETTMSDQTLKISPQLLQQVPQVNAGELDLEADVNAATVQKRIPLTVRSRTKVLRVAPPIDDGFRPFRVF
jgi:hypothetical protein